MFVDWVSKCAWNPQARSTICKYIGEGSFPKPVSLGDRCVGWVDAEVQEWILARIKERDVAEGRDVR